MKTYFIKLISVLALLLGLVSCGEEKFPSQYVLVLPKAPEAWVSLLGEPHWRVEWQNPGGQKQIKAILPNENIGIDLPQAWTSAILAWPYWPEQDIGPGLFRPAGALFPFDSSANRINLSWKAGPDAVFYWELAIAGEEIEAESKVPRIPHNFDWPRFRELFETDVLNEMVRQDPWLADWRSIAEKTVKSGFDRRRLVPESGDIINIPVSSGPWYGGSPFTAPLWFEEGEIPAFPVRSAVEVWICGEGILRCNKKAQVFTPWNN